MTTATQARIAIENILASIDEDDLPEPDSIETRSDGQVVVFFDSTGYCLGSARTLRDGTWENDPLSYRSNAAHDAITREAVCRLDAKHLAETKAGDPA